MSKPYKFGLIGAPVAHSQSPVMHQAGFSVLGIEATYELRQVPTNRPELVEVEMRLLASRGGGNVTVPHKAAAARALDRPTETVTALGACNCFWEAEPGILAGDNTDVVGIRRSLETRLRNHRPRHVLILGAGGAAAAAGLAAGQLGASDVHIVNRTPGRARLLVERLAAAGVNASVLEERPSAEYEVIINATSLGLHEGDALPLSFEGVSTSLVLDLVYGLQRTAWTRMADAAGIDWIDGREVLLNQAVACYPLWFGTEAPIEHMRSALFDEVR